MELVLEIERKVPFATDSGHDHERTSGIRITSRGSMPWRARQGDNSGGASWTTPVECLAGCPSTDGLLFALTN